MRLRFNFIIKILIFPAILFLWICNLEALILPDRYHTYQEVVDTIGALAGIYPDIIYVDTMGYSTRDSIPLISIKLSDNPSVNEDEPAIFFVSGVHADEVLGVEVMINFLNDITGLYSRGDPEIINYLNALEIFVVPVINPEGRLVVESGDHGWRKNKSDNDGSNSFDFHDGVDNNRNYDFGWDMDMAADAVTPESLQFKGRAPFTEAENIAMAEFGWKYRPLIALDLHSPIYGRPNVAYYPWYWYASEGGHGFSPDEKLMRSICQEYTSRIMAIPDESGTITYTARRALVNKGDFKTYFYGNFGTAAFSVEISDTTIQDQALVDSITKAHLPGLYWLLGRALGPAITGIIRDSITFEPIEAEVQVLQHINEDINPRLSRPDFGRYRRLLAPGTYTLRFIKDGYHPKDIYNVIVGPSNPAETNVYLSPVNPVPSPPVLKSPVDSSTIESDFVYFSWERPSGATGYVIEIARDGMFTRPVEIDSAVIGESYLNRNKLMNGRYFWRCSAYNDNGNSDRSETCIFTIMLPPPAPIPELIFPVDDADTLLVTFMPGDVNGDGQVIASDVTFLVNFFRGLAAPPIAVDGYFPAADTNGDCLVIGSDVTRLVNFFRGRSGLPRCADFRSKFHN